LYASWSSPRWRTVVGRTVEPSRWRPLARPPACGGAVFVRPHSPLPLHPPPRAGREAGSCRVGKIRRPEPLPARPRGSAASGSPDGVVESGGLRSWAVRGGYATHMLQESPLRFRPWALAGIMLEDVGTVDKTQRLLTLDLARPPGNPQDCRPSVGSLALRCHSCLPPFVQTQEGDPGFPQGRNIWSAGLLQPVVFPSPVAGCHRLRELH
jgi:hypothetical protein